MDLEFEDLIGAEIAPHIERLAELRIAVFREYPYLYEGDLEYERSYLQKLAESDHGYVVLAKDGDTIVGASTAMPLSDAGPEFQKPFLEQELDPDDYFYFGESVLLPEYRGGGNGNRFFEEREAQAHFLAYPFSCFCAVVRPDDHPGKPQGYAPLNAFWTRRGYKRRTDLVTSFSWKEVGESEESAKPMEFWVRKEDAPF